MFKPFIQTPFKLFRFLDLEKFHEVCTWWVHWMAHFNEESRGALDNGAVYTGTLNSIVIYPKWYFPSMSWIVGICAKEKDVRLHLKDTRNFFIFQRIVFWIIIWVKLVLNIWNCCGLRREQSKDSLRECEFEIYFLKCIKPIRGDLWLTLDSFESLKYRRLWKHSYSIRCIISADHNSISSSQKDNNSLFNYL